MSITPQTFASPALGMVPDIGPFLAAGFNAESTSSSDQHILNTISEISNEVEDLNNELISFEAQSQLYGLYKAINDAPGNINTFYSPKNNPSVGDWIQKALSGQSPASLTTYTSQEIKQWLLGIDGAVMGTQNPYRSWMHLLIEYYLAKYKSEPDHSVLPHSLLEKSYRSFLWMVQIQLKGLLCLRAVGEGADELAKQGYILMKNIIAQGKHCQEVVNTYITSNEQEFVWLQSRHSTPYICDLSNQNDQVATVSTGQDLPLVGVQFGLNNGVTGIQIHECSLDQYGRVKINKTDKWYGYDNDKVIVSGGYTTAVANPSDAVVAGPGEVLTGIKFDYSVGTDSDNDPMNVLNLEAYSSLLDDNGNSVTTKTLKQNFNPGTTSHYQAYLLSQDQMSTIPLTLDSPVTGMYYNIVNRHINIALATSLHQNAFTPYAVGSSPQVLLRSLNHGTVLYPDLTTKTVSLESPASLSSNPSITAHVILNKQAQGTNYTYGDQVTAYTLTKGLYLTGDSNNSVNIAPVGRGAFQWWILVDPNDINNKGETVYNWSAVALKNKATNTYLTANNGPILTKLSSSNSSGNRIIDPNLVWNIPLRG